MKLTPQQRAVAEAYAATFADSAQIRLVLDDLQVAINGMSEPHQMGAWRLYGYIQLKASALRRAKRRDGNG